MLLTAFTAVASVAQPVKRSPELRVLTPEQMNKELAAKPMPVKKTQAPRKANVTVDDLVGNYSAKVNNYTYKVTLKASDVEGEVILSGLWEFDDFKATVDAENSRLAIELGQVVLNHHLYGKIILGVYEATSDEIVSTGTLYALVHEDGSITFPSNVYICMIIAEGDYAGDTYYSYIYPVLTLTPGFPDFALTPWDDKNLTFLGDGDLVGDVSTLVTGVASNGDDWVGLEITTTDLVNVEDPDDQLPLSVNNNLSYLTPILVGEDEILCNNGLDADNKPFSTLVGEHEFILIDGYGSDEDFEAVKDVLAGKIAVCYRGGGVSYYIKANAAVANGAIGLIVVNSQEGIININLSGYKYDKPVAIITKADGVLLKESATYVDGEVSYYQGSLTVTDEEKPYHFSFVYTYGNEEEDNEGEVKAVVQDWTNATPGATYQATINYAVTYRKYNEELDTWEEKEAEMAPTTLTVRVLNNSDLVITPWDDVELTYGSTEGDLIGSPNTLVSGLDPDSRDYVTIKVTSTNLENYWYSGEGPLYLDFGGNIDITYYYGYGYEPYSDEFDVRAVISDTKYAHPEEPYVAYLTYEVTYYEYDAETDSYFEYPLTTEKTMLWVWTPSLDIVFTPWADSELTYGNTEGDVVGTKSALLSGLPDSKYNYAAVSVTNTHLINVADPDDQLILALKAPTWETDNLMDYNPLLVAGKEIEYSEQLNGYGNEPISTIVGDHKFIYIDNYGDVEDFEKVKDVLEGKIAVCNRGGISFYVKANAAAANGAIALIVVNNQEGTINMNLSGYEYDKPAVSILQTDGAWLKENATYVDGDAPYYQGTLTIGETEIGHSIYGMGIGYNESTGADYSDYELSAYVYDWTNATPGATYQATITYTAATYYDYYFTYYYVSTALEIGTPTTTLTVTIPEENAIEGVNADMNAEGRTYNLLGIPVGKDYKGVVIQNGRKVLVK